MAPWVIGLRMNNNYGVIDEHYGFDWDQGLLDYTQLQPMLRQLLDDPVIALEMDRIDDMKNRLRFFQLHKLPWPSTLSIDRQTRFPQQLRADWLDSSRKAAKYEF